MHDAAAGVDVGFSLDVARGGLWLSRDGLCTPDRYKEEKKQKKTPDQEKETSSVAA